MYFSGSGDESEDPKGQGRGSGQGSDKMAALKDHLSASGRR